VPVTQNKIWVTGIFLFSKEDLLNRILTLAILGLVFAATAVSEGARQKPEPSTKNAPTVDQVIDRYIKAVGGTAAIEKITTRVMRGSLVTSGGTARLEVYEKTPNKFLVIVENSAAGLSQNGFNGVVAWSQNAQRGSREMKGPEVENFKREYDLHREIKLKEFYPKMSVTGRETIGDRDAFVVEAATVDGVSEVLYFDVGTGLLFRRDVTVQGTTLQAYLEDYREVDGIKIPFTIRRSRSDFSFTYKFDEVKHNIAVEDSKFNTPAPQ